MHFKAGTVGLYRLFEIAGLSVCNAIVALCFGIYLGSDKPVRELTRFFLQFETLTVSMAVLCLVVGIVAYLFATKTLNYLRGLALTQFALTTFAFFLPVIAPTSPDEDEKWALQVLAPERHLSDPMRLNPLTDKTALRSYDAQLNAIHILGETKKTTNVPTLIRYLDYPISSADAAIRSPQINENVPGAMADMEAVWPAFAALLATPNSERTLANYILDKDNPENYRLTALVVLSYKDKRMYQSTYNKITSNESANSSMLRLANVIHAQPRGILFWGLVEMGTLNKLADLAPLPPK